MWLAELLAYGLIRASFVPDAQTQEMRNLLRTQQQLVREISWVGLSSKQTTGCFGSGCSA
jgi:hypothetical protein